LMLLRLKRVDTFKIKEGIDTFKIKEG